MEHDGIKNKENMPQKRKCAENDKSPPEKKLKTDTISQPEANSQDFIKNLLSKAMSDSSHQKSIFLIKLNERIHEVSIEHDNVLNCILSWMLIERRSFKDEDNDFLLKVMYRVLQNCDIDRIRPLITRIIVVTQPFIEDCSSHCCIKAGEIIYALSKIAGLDEVAALIRLQMNDTSEYVRDVAVKAMGIVASALGIPAVFPFIESCCRRIEPFRVRCAAIRMVEQVAVRMGCTLRPHLKSLVQLIEFGLRHKDLEIMKITALSLAALAKAVAPYGYEEFEPILNCLFDFLAGDGVGFVHRRGNQLGALVKLFTCVIPILTESCPIRLQWYVANGVWLVGKLSGGKVDDEETKEVALEAIKNLAKIQSVALIGFLVGEPRGLVRIMWRRTTMSRNKYMLLVDATIALAKKLGVAYVKRAVSKELYDYSEDYKRMALKIIEKVLACPGTSPDRNARLEDIFQDIAYLFCSSF